MEYIPYAARDGNTGRTMVEAVLKLLGAPQRVVAIDLTHGDDHEHPSRVASLKADRPVR